MKSMLYEASSVIKAIESAWEQSGKPSEFTIKVLEGGEKGILWFTKQPAIVSMSYDPKKQTVKEAASDKNIQTFTKNKKRTPQQHNTQKLTHHNKKDDLEIRKTTNLQKSSPDGFKKQPPQKNVVSPSPTNTWTNEHIDDVTRWLKETMNILNKAVTFSTTVHKRTLRVELDENIIPEANENKAFNISLSSLLMQSLKKKFKKKFQGFNIIITPKNAVDNGTKKANSNP